MANLATPGANALLDGTPLPATLWVQLHVGNPGANGTANVATETTRKSFTRTAAAGGVSANSGLMQWPAYPASETITHVSVWSASSSGTCWFIGDPGNQSIAVNDTVQILAGDLDLICTLWA